MSTPIDGEGKHHRRRSQNRIQTRSNESPRGRPRPVFFSDGGEGLLLAAPPRTSLAAFRPGVHNMSAQNATLRALRAEASGVIVSFAHVPPTLNSRPSPCLHFPCERNAREVPCPPPFPSLPFRLVRQSCCCSLAKRRLSRIPPPSSPPPPFPLPLLCPLLVTWRTWRTTPAQSRRAVGDCS